MKPPAASSPAVAAVMSGNRKWDTRPEVRLRSRLHASGLRYRKHWPIKLASGESQLTVRPDVVFTRARVAVFVDGCFWHSCPKHGRSPQSNHEYWSEKLRRNIARDRLVDSALAEAGWDVVRIWEHESAEDAAGRVHARVLARRQRSQLG